MADTAMNALQAKAAQSSAPPLGGLVQPASGSAPASAPQAPAGGAPQSQDGSVPAGAPQGSALPDESKADSSGNEQPVKIKQDFSRVHEKLTELIDGLGVHRDFTIPYSNSPAADNVTAVNAAAQKVGGLSKVLMTTFHHAKGRGFGTEDGMTVGFNADRLHGAIIPKDSESAKAVVTAANRFLHQAESLIGKTPAIETAKGQLALIGKNSLAGMNAMDTLIAFTQVLHPVMQNLAKVHSFVKGNGEHGVRLSPPKAREQQAEASTEAAQPAAPPAETPQAEQGS